MGEMIGKIGWVVMFASVCTTARAFTGSLAQQIAPLLVGVTSNNLSDRDWAPRDRLDPRGTVLLSGVRKDGIENCTGTVILSTSEETRVITAKHCVDPKNPTGGVNIDGVESTGVYSATDPDTDEDISDISLVTFPAGTAEFLGVRKFPKLATKPMKPGDKVYLAGFGLDSIFSTGKKNGAGIRRWGVTTVEKREGGALCTKETVFRRDPTPDISPEVCQPDASVKEEENLANAQVLPGDSGGAVYNSDGEVVGIASMIKLRREGPHVNLPLLGPIFVKITSIGISSRFVDLVDNDVLHDFLKEAWDPAWKLERSSRVAKHPVLALFNAVLANTISEDPFAHVTLRTGRYLNTEDPKNSLWIQPLYHRRKLLSFSLRSFKDNGVSASRNFECNSKRQCVDLSPRSNLAYTVLENGRLMQHAVIFSFAGATVEGDKVTSSHYLAVGRPVAEFRFSD